jgi:hypothetical protein
MLHAACLHHMALAAWTIRECKGSNCITAASALKLLLTVMWRVYCTLLWQVEQILNLRTDLMEAAEKLRRSEAERQTLETDITSLRQQVCSCAWAAEEEYQQAHAVRLDSTCIAVPNRTSPVGWRWPGSSSGMIHMEIRALRNGDKECRLSCGRQQSSRQQMVAHRALHVP